MTNQSREDADQATGLPDLPKLIFLDTNIVQNLNGLVGFDFQFLEGLGPGFCLDGRRWVKSLRAF